MLRSASIVFLVLLPGVGREATAQRRVPQPTSGARDESIAVTIAAKIGNKSYKASGSGGCKHAAEASIHGVSASLWMVEYTNPREAGLKQLRLTLWRPKDDGPDQLSLSLDTSSGPHRIETGGQGKSAGEGTVTILPSGPGGRLEISGKEAGGKAIQVTIDCPAFAGVEAEGG